MFPFGPLAPDAGELEPGVCLVANGVLPLKTGYGPAASLFVEGGAEALSAAPRGLVSLVLNDGTWKVFGYTDDDIEVMAADYTWTSIGAGAFSLTSGDDWCGMHFGNYLLSTNTTEGLIAYNVETPAGFSAIAAAGDPRFIFTCANMVFALDCLDASGNRDNRLIRNSDFNSFTEWKKGAADYQPLEDGGALLAGFDLRDGAALIVQEQRALDMLDELVSQSVVGQFGSTGVYLDMATP